MTVFFVEVVDKSAESEVEGDAVAEVEVGCWVEAAGEAVADTVNFVVEVD